MEVKNRFSGSIIGEFNISARADLCGAKNIPEYVIATTTIIPDGAIIVWKKTKDGIVKLRVPVNAKRSNATGRKCRFEYAKDIAHFHFDGQCADGEIFHSQYDNSEYIVGQTIYPDSFDEDRWSECSNGIHAFLTRWEAENY